MQIVLLEDVKTLGKKGQIVKVNDGYARNFILPKHLGEEATAANLAKLANQKKHEEKVAAENLAAAKEQALKMAAITVKIPAKVGEGGKLFGSIAGKEIAEATEKQFGLVLDKKKFVLPDPIKTLGEHDITVKLHKDVTAVLKVVITEQ